MTRNLLIFLGTFTAGALVALITRAALHDPHEGHEAHAAAAPTPAPMVANALVAPPRAPAPAPEAATHDHHAAAPATAAQAATDRSVPVNTICAICGMDVGPGSVTAEYKGKTIGFGCAGCLPRFKADPDKYGPYYLRNEVMAP